MLNLRYNISEGYWKASYEMLNLKISRFSGVANNILQYIDRYHTNEIEKYIKYQKVIVKPVTKC